MCRDGRKTSRPRNSLRIASRALYSDPAEFQRVERAKGEPHPAILWRARSRCSICSISKSKSIPDLLKQITAKANAIEKAFNGYRPDIAGKQMTDSEVRKVLKESQRTRPSESPSGKGPKGVGAAGRMERKRTRQAS